ncbi:hypothetical protein TcWFU_001136 [Taenia crassiceps]|uniref:Uncharacterized protein n=1 Tax=Taenia crassiceps TaxID=6207 RepID=A0ABR4QNQ1_9CEST
MSQSLFFDLLRHTVDTFHIQCICTRMLSSAKRVVFQGIDLLGQPMKVEITEGDRPTFASVFKARLFT